VTPPSRIPVLVIGGYLGAGKTTLINTILQNAEQRIAVVVNDFGSVNIDAELIAEKHDDTIELTNGCICCAVGESLADVLFAIADRPTRPDLVIIEASGVANPASVAAFTHIESFHHLGNVVLVDTLHAERTANDPLVGKTFKIQLQSADLIVLTKTDSANTDAITTVQTLVASLASQVPILQVSSLRLADILTNTSVTEYSETSADHTHFTTMTLEHVAAATDDQLRTFLNNFPSSVVRAKGIVELSDGTHRLIQKVGSTVTISETALPTSGLVVITAQQRPRASRSQ
jgi:G3E family GTPase